MTREEVVKDMEEIKEIINCDADAETKYKMISNILTAKPHYFEKQEPKTGHWIEEIDDYGKVIGWHCDNCYEDSGFTTDCKWDFCPSCGAKMVEPQESEDECKNCEYYINPDYTRCHECKAESEDKE